MSAGRKSRTPCWLTIFLLLTLCFLSSSTCRTKVVVSPVLIGEARITGKIVAGTIKWEPNENQTQNAYIVTPAFVKVCLGLAIQCAELKAEIKKLQAKGN